MKIFSKITCNEYNNRLERILDNKTFDENTKNLLLSMLYKIENGYNDYEKVKYNAISKEEYIEKILNIVEEQCYEIKVVTPKTESSKPLEQENVVCKIDIARGSILVYANEENLLYSLIKMNLLQEEYKYENSNQLVKTNSNFSQKAMKQFLIKAICINESEIIRDFDGWSWNNNIKNNEDIEYNLVFQNMMLLNTNNDINSMNLEQILQEEQTFEKYMYIMILTLASKQNESINSDIKTRLNELTRLFELMENKKSFLETISEKKKNIFNEIGKIEQTINDKEKLKKEYDKRNSKLQNKDKIFSVSFLIDILIKEKEKKLEELKELNNFLTPSKYVNQKQKLENEYTILNNVVINLNDERAKRQTIINMQIEFLKRFTKEIEKNSNNKEELEKIIYTFRYYCLIPVEQRKNISDISELEGHIEKVMNTIIDKCIDKEVIINISNSASLCYNILKYVFITKIVNLRQIHLQINKIKTEKYVNETKDTIQIIISVPKEAENVYNENVYNLNLLNVKTNKKIPLFLK